MRPTANNIYFLHNSFYRALLPIVVLLCSFGWTNAERWKFHPAFDNLPVRIVDTERYTYYQVLQKLYDKNASSYNVPITALLTFDKKDRCKGFFPLSDMRNLSGESVRFCEYNPAGECLVILYLDGVIDIVSDSGNVISNSYLKDNSVPGLSKVNSMTLSGDEVWVATEAGYLVVNGKTGRTLCFAPVDLKISYISRCGDRIVAFAGNKVYAYEGKGYPKRVSDFQEVSLPGGQPNARVLMPRSDGAFFYIGDRKSSGNYSVNVAWYTETGWKSRFLSDINTYLPGVNGRITNEFERTFTRNKEGWCVTGDTYICQLYDKRDVAGDTVFEAVATVKASSPAERRVLSVAGTWDGSTCQTYSDRGRFTEGTRGAEGYLVDDDRALRPNLPAVGHTNNLVYIPGYGTGVINYGYCWAFPLLGNAMPPLLSIYGEGKWSLPNPVYNMPRSAESDPGLRNLYTTYLNRFPVTDPTGLVVDPLNNNWVWMGSSYSGIAALNVRDPKADPIHLGSAADPLKDYPGFKDVFPDVTGWRGFNGVSAPSFDRQGNLWAAYLYFDGIKEGTTPMRLVCWPMENREAAFTGGTSGDVMFFDIQAGSSINSTMKALAISKNSRISDAVLCFVPNSPVRKIARFRHNGTLNDLSDDKVDVIFKIRDQHGTLWEIAYAYSMIEDSEGMVWLGEKDTLLGFDPASEVKDNVIDGWVLDLKEGEVMSNPFNSVPVYGAIREDGGRLWVATGGLGLYCISSDLSKLEAHYTTSNSGLPSDVCYGMAWNPETLSLMVSTDAGLCELWPDGVGNGTASVVSIFPREILPEYEGKVMVRGAGPHSSVSVINKDGEVIKTLATDSSGKAMWDLSDKDGRTVGNGFYILRGDFGDEEIVVNK